MPRPCISQPGGRGKKHRMWVVVERVIDENAIGDINPPEEAVVGAKMSCSPQGLWFGVEAGGFNAHWAVAVE